MLLTIRWKRQRNISDKMKMIEEFVGYIVNGEKRLAERALKELAENSPCAEYEEALRKVFLADIAKKLNRDIFGFYCDTDKLIKSMFEDGGINSASALEMIFDIAKESLNDTDEKTFEKARSYIIENLCDCQLSVSGTAEYSGTTQSNLTKLFKSYIEITPGEYVNNLRIEESKKLLESGLPIEKTAEMVGFSSSSGYIRAFKRHMGITPGEWKRNKLFL